MSNSGGEWGCREQVKVNPTRGCPPGVGVYMAHIQNPRSPLSGLQQLPPRDPSGLTIRLRKEAPFALLAPGAPTYFISTIFRTERKSPARNPYRYTPVATLAPEASRPSHSNS